MAQSRIFDEKLSLEHRYVTEDVALGLSLFESAGRTVTVCIDAGSSPSTWPSRELTSGIFAGIGVTIQWRLDSRDWVLG